MPDPRRQPALPSLKCLCTAQGGEPYRDECPIHRPLPDWMVQNEVGRARMWACKRCGWRTSPSYCGMDDTAARALAVAHVPQCPEAGLPYKPGTDAEFCGYCWDRGHATCQCPPSPEESFEASPGACPTCDAPLIHTCNCKRRSCSSSGCHERGRADASAALYETINRVTAERDALRAERDDWRKRYEAQTEHAAQLGRDCKAARDERDDIRSQLRWVADYIEGKMHVPGRDPEQDSADLKRILGTHCWSTTVAMARKGGNDA